jgi:S1-C subfamily serine protease
VSPRLLASSLIVGAAVGLVSCGGDDKSPASPTTGTAEGAAEESSIAESDVYFGVLKIAPPSGGEAGAVVRLVEEGSPFAASGLRRGDRIVALDGGPIAGVPELLEALDGLARAHDSGDRLKVMVSRRSRQRVLTLTLAPNVYLGANVATASPGRRGAFVDSVQPGSPAAAGLRRGDQITAIDGKPIADVLELFEALGAHIPGDEVEITVSRGSRRLAVTATLAARPGAGEPEG